MAQSYQQAAQAAPSLLSLPPEVLLHILASVPLSDRLCHVVLACKQLGMLCTAPELLSELDVQFRGPTSVACTQALLRFLLRHGGHVCSLQLDIRLTEDGSEGGPEYDDVASLVPACLAACAAQQGHLNGSLRQLSFTPDTPLLSVAIVPLLTALEELQLPGRSVNMQLRLGSGWRQLMALRSAHLSGRLVCEGEGPALPPSLTRLCIEGDLETDAEDDPPLDGRVLAGLSALHYLTLAESSYTAASLGALGGLTALTRLALLRVDNLPPLEALAALAPSLRVLEVHSMVGEGAINSCVQALTGLESLALDLGFNWTEDLSLQPAMLALPRLRCLSLTAYDNRQGGGPGSGRRPSNLPEGPYLSALQSLAMPLPLALSALPVLAQAQHLHTLCLQLPTIELPFNPDHGLAFWRFVATHPPLRRLLYEVPASSVAFSYELHDALMLLKSHRPALEVRRLTAPDNRVLEPPACWAELSAS